MTTEERKEANKLIDSVVAQGYSDPRKASQEDHLEEMIKYNMLGLKTEVAKGKNASPVYIKEKIGLLTRNLSVLIGCDQSDLLP
jgi:hypothetical protein